MHHEDKLLLLHELLNDGFVDASHEDAQQPPLQGRWLAESLLRRMSSFFFFELPFTDARRTPPGFDWWTETSLQHTSARARDSSPHWSSAPACYLTCQRRCTHTSRGRRLLHHHRRVSLPYRSSPSSVIRSAAPHLKPAANLGCSQALHYRPSRHKAC